MYSFGIFIAEEIRTNARLKVEEDEEAAEGMKPADVKVRARNA